MTSEEVNWHNVLEKKIQAKTVHVGIIGLGYVGMPLAQAFVSRGISVTGFDIDDEKIASIDAGHSYIGHIPSSEIQSLTSNGFSATSDFARLSDVDAILICVPTPLTDDLQPDMKYVEDSAKVIARHLVAGQLIALESTTYPGTTDEVMRPILESGGLVSGEDFFLAYSPEREDPANKGFTTATIPKVVGGDGAEALALAVLLYGLIIKQVVPASSTATAEAVKLTENIFRAVNIALVNELKVIYAKMGIDIWEVIDAAKTKPFGYMPFYPGPGLGGHCIPIDPFYLSWKAAQHGADAEFIELAGRINRAMPDYVIGTLESALQERFSRSLKGAKILLIGLAYKKNVSDVRESPAFALIKGLEARGTSVSYHDPLVPSVPKTREHGGLAGRKSVDLSPDFISGCDAVLICTDHDEIDYGALVVNARLVVDTRNATADVTEGRDKIVKS